MPPPGVGHDPLGWCCAGRGDRSMVEVAGAASLSAGRPVERLPGGGGENVVGGGGAGGGGGGGGGAGYRVAGVPGAAA